MQEVVELPENTPASRRKACQGLLYEGM